MTTQVCTIQHRALHEVNTDPERRCYNGCHAKSEFVWSAWEDLDYVPPERLESKLKFWRELNEYAVSQRGKSALTEYRVV